MNITTSGMRHESFSCLLWLFKGRFFGGWTFNFGGRCIRLLALYEVRDVRGLRFVTWDCCWRCRGWGAWGSVVGWFAAHDLCESFLHFFDWLLDEIIKRKGSLLSVMAHLFFVPLIRFCIYRNLNFLIRLAKSDKWDLRGLLWKTEIC